ncbi:protocatechuate 3,4-dioxygenase subunit alpha [Denitrobaculum tricleocarpae]|uniref:Protocatechuate 3,4-dioxygenase subunit alpha n=1 Tax=Denitrobaculum tricleocarpae TaxID=2591009 RepID=A0A545U1H1_9PROT|nr:protocatechuate 3,4-dioxygenase subunit alpha [Denitrobaculum tricleocarpae]TQV83315.1 protocatechuate 3,4-dioxygenase subunit alpha [Denitrobaculum tricleocarpae]
MAFQHTQLKESPSQTAGPFVQMGLTPNFTGIHSVYENDLGGALINDKTEGERIVVTGQIFDGVGSPINDAIIEVWQADAKGRYNSPFDPSGKCDKNFFSWGRIPVDPETGIYSFSTIKPGRVPIGSEARMAPHITFWIVARGINLGLHTRMYFADEGDANAEDAVLTELEHQHRASTLLAELEGDIYKFNIYLQGARETVFLDI